MSIISKKICIVGEPGVGKNSLIRRFVDRKFSNEYLATVGVTISRKRVELPDEKSQRIINLQLILWDITGAKQFKAVVPNYLQGSSGAIVVADVSRQDTIERLPDHIQLVLSANPQSVIFVALNKADLILHTKLENLILHKPLKPISGLYVTSAKTGLLVDEIFQQLAYKILESSDHSPANQPLPLGDGKPVSLESEAQG